MTTVLISTSTSANSVEPSQVTLELKKNYTIPFKNHCSGQKSLRNKQKSTVLIYLRKMYPTGAISDDFINYQKKLEEAKEIKQKRKN